MRSWRALAYAGIGVSLLVPTGCSTARAAQSQHATSSTSAASTAAAVSTTHPASGAGVEIPAASGVVLQLNARLRRDGTRYVGSTGVTTVAAPGHSVLGVSLDVTLADSDRGPVHLSDGWGAPGLPYLLVPLKSADGVPSCLPDPLHLRLCRLATTVDPPAALAGTTITYGEGAYLTTVVPDSLNLRDVTVVFETPTGFSYDVPTRIAAPGSP